MPAGLAFQWRCSALRRLASASPLPPSTRRSVGTGVEEQEEGTAGHTGEPDRDDERLGGCCAALRMRGGEGKPLSVHVASHLPRLSETEKTIGLVDEHIEVAQEVSAQDPADGWVRGLKPA